MPKHRDPQQKPVNIVCAGWQVFSLLMLSVAVLAALTLIVVPRLSGSYTYTVLTGSMAPLYPAGTFLVVKPVAYEQLRAGDVITYQIESGRPEVITHRIVGVSSKQSGERTLITKGDNNTVADNDPVIEAQVRGKLFYAVPYVGFLANFAAQSDRDSILRVAAIGLVGYGTISIALGLLGARKQRASG